MQHRKGIIRGRLIIFIVGHQTPAEIGRKHLCGFEMGTGERGFTRPGWAYKYHERQFRNCEFHRVNIPICVGGPNASSGGPMGEKRTV